MYVDKGSGISWDTSHPFGAALAEACREGDRSTAAWVKQLKADGVKAAHPDDGWVNRDENYVVLCYPDFNLRPEVGDLIALGTFRKYRLVRVIRVELPKPFAYEPLRRWYFEGVATRREGKP